MAQTQLLRPVSARWHPLAALAAVVLMASGVGVIAQSSGSELDLESIRARADAISADAQALVRHLREEAAKQREAAQETASAANDNLQRLSDVVLPAGAKGPVDFDEIVKGASTMAKGERGAPLFIVFASLSMPQKSLKALIEDTAKAGGVIVFRGFPENSMKKFASAIGKIVDDKTVFGNVGIDPRLFRAYRVESVPTYVAASSDFDVCDGFDCTTVTPPSDRMSGNVTVEYALTTFVEGRGPGAGVAKVALGQLKAKR